MRWKKLFNTSINVISRFSVAQYKKAHRNFIIPSVATETLTEIKIKRHVLPQTAKRFYQNVLNSRNTDDWNNKKKGSKYFLILLGLSVTGFGVYLFISAEEMKENANSEETSLFQEKSYYRRFLEYIQRFTLMIQEPSREKLLPDPLAYPYYQPPYTLVFEFTDVLAHPEWTYKTGWRFKKRPGVDYMLENLVGLYEIIVFTAEPGITIFPVIEALDQKSLISYKLVRDSTHFIDGHHIKNLDKLNRDLKKVIIVDWNTKSVKFHPDNHFVIDRWTGEDEDKTLIELTSFLQTIAHTKIEDVREVLKFYKQFDDPLETFKRKQIEFLEQQNQAADKTKMRPSIKRTFDYLI